MLQGVKNQYHLGQAVFSNLLHRFPARGMVIIGVTGTDGKTTTSNYIYHMLKAAGKKVAIISTISAVIDGTEYTTKSHVTTPSSSTIQKYLRKAKEKGVEYVVLEVTSHALDQHRVFGIPFTIGVLTNISHEHLDYHKTIQNYTRAKCKLLRKAKYAVVNKDDDSYRRVSDYRYHIPQRKVVTYGMKKDAVINPHSFPFTTKLMGNFNQYNAMAAITVGKLLGLSDSVIRRSIASTPYPKGREEVVYEKDFTVMIDFAHTPHALKNILQAVHEKMNGRGRLIHVFGSAGERDATKRPSMGKTSAKYADIIILTAEDPRKEKVTDIIRAIHSGIDRKREIFEIENRSEAIQKAISLARKHDFVLITGKGHENSMNLGKGEEKWSDREAAEIALDLMRVKN